MNNRRTEMILVRHAETAWNAEGRIQGHLDIPLSDTGLAQAAVLGRRLGPEPFDAIYSSDLDRAFRTATPVVQARDLAIQRDPRLRERHLGVLQGLTGEEAAIRHPLAWKIFRARLPGEPLEGGESLGEFSRRVIDFIEGLRRCHSGARILLVTHGGVLDAAYRHATQMSVEAPRDFPIYNASLNILDHREGRWAVRSWGDVSHLPPELAMDDT